MVITIQCPECSTSFPVDPAKIPAGGVKVRCSSCSAIFRVERPAEAAPPPPPAPEPEPAPEPAPEPEAEPEPEPEPEPTPEPEPAPEPEPEPTFEAPVFEAPPPAEEGEVPDRYASETDFSVGTDAPTETAVPAEPDEWVLERDEDIDPGSLNIEPVGTVQESMEEAKDEAAFFGTDATLETGADVMQQGALPETPAEAAEVESPAADAEPVMAEPAMAEPVTEEPPAAPEPPAEEPAAKPASGFTFGKRDPHDKARRLARVLVSDIITYNPDRHDRALSAGTLKEDFEDEIGKSWKEYVEQVGDEIAGSTAYWTEALNDVLAKGQQIF